jgi:hypothetical protein
MAALKANGLKRTFGGVRAADSIDLEIAEGEIYAFLGPNDAGKDDHREDAHHAPAADRRGRAGCRVRRRIGGRHVRGAYAPLELLTGWLHTVAR